MTPIPYRATVDAWHVTIAHGDGVSDVIFARWSSTAVRVLADRLGLDADRMEVEYAVTRATGKQLDLLPTPEPVRQLTLVETAGDVCAP